MNNHPLKLTMQDLINRLRDNVGISEEQATSALHEIKEYVKEKFPMMAGAVDNLFATSKAPTAVSPGGPDLPNPESADAAGSENIFHGNVEKDHLG